MFKFLTAAFGRPRREPISPGLVLERLRTLEAETPDFAAYAPTSAKYNRWVSRTAHLVGLVDPSGEKKMREDAGWLVNEGYRAAHVARILQRFHQAIATLESAEERDKLAEAFAPGAVYDFFRSLRGIVAGAKSTLLIVDPYLDPGIFDTYLTDLPPSVKVRLMTRHSSAALKPAAAAFVAQHHASVDIRTSPELHDRVLFADQKTCWVVGQSLKDAAKSKATYLAQLPDDIAQTKFAYYDQVWQKGTPI